MTWRKLIITAAIVILSILLFFGAVYGILFLKERGRTADMDFSDYITVSFKGYDTLGTAEVVFDADRFTADFKQYARVPSKRKLERAGLSSAYIDNIADKVSFRLSKDEDLSNGDKIYVYVNYNADAMELFHVDVAEDVISVTVSGLAELVTIDLFEDDVTNYSGMSPYMDLSLSPYRKNGLFINFTADKTENIASGESITVSAGTSREQLAAWGYQAESLTHIYTAPAADSYITEAGQLSGSMLGLMQEKAEEEITKYDQYNLILSTTGYKYMGYLITYPEQLTLLTPTNHVYLVYSVQVTAIGKSWSPATVYMPVEFKTVTSTADGTQRYENCAGIRGTTDLNLMLFSYVKGYTSLTDMLEELVNPLTGTYEYTADDLLSGEIR